MGVHTRSVQRRSLLVIFSLKFHKDPGAGAGPLASEWLLGDIDGALRRISSDTQPSEPSNDQHHSLCQST